MFLRNVLIANLCDFLSRSTGSNLSAPLSIPELGGNSREDGRRRSRQSRARRRRLRGRSLDFPAMARNDAFVDHLQQVPMFSACSKRDLQLVARRAEDVRVPAGKVLV